MTQSNIPQTGQEWQRAEARHARPEGAEPVTAPTTAPGPLDREPPGETTLEDTVVAKVTGMATREVPGVYALGGAGDRAASAVADRIANSQTHVTGGISVEKGLRQTAIDITVVVEHGTSILEVGDAIRRTVITQVESATGLEVVEVNVHVTDVHLPGEDQDEHTDRAAQLQ